MNGALPIAAQTRQMAPAEPIYDGEVVEDLPRAVGRAVVRWFVNWWVRCRCVPAALRSRQALREAAKDLIVWVVRSPFRFVGAVSRGLVVAARGWRRWVRVHDYRDAAEQAEKLADKFIEIRALSLFRWKLTAAAVWAGAVAMTIVDLVYGASALWITAGAGAVALAITGRRKDGSPGRKAVLAGPRTLTWTMDPQVLVDAFRDAKLIGKDESLRLVERASRVGDGWAITVDLPATRKAADVIKYRDALASALAVDEVQLIVERVRGKGGHAGRVFLWVADEDPYSGPPLRTPLLDVECWDAWRPVPFGRDARQRRIDLPLVWTSLLVGAIPRQGKTFAIRLPAAGLILDPYTRLYVFDGKGGKDWDAAEAVAYRFVRGDELDHAYAVRDHLVELVAEVQSRFARMATLDDEICPESKITPAISRDPNLGMPITAVIIDEVHVFLENPTREHVGGKKTTLGEYIADLLTYLVPQGARGRNRRHPGHPTPGLNHHPLPAAGGTRVTVRPTGDGLAGLQHRAGRADEHPRIRRLDPAPVPQGSRDPTAGRRDRRRGGRAGNDGAHLLHAQPPVATDLRTRTGVATVSRNASRSRSRRRSATGDRPGQRDEGPRRRSSRRHRGAESEPVPRVAGTIGVHCGLSQ
jgi:S-DNA-T family DNA segregation ATPase FtsK/SpoIIIE